jgi:hypothetical protein
MYLFVFGLSLIVQNVQAQSCQLMQGHNGGIGLPVVSPLDFQRGNSNHSKAHFEEGNSVPYKIEFGTLQPNVQYKVRIGFDVKKNGKYALDYLTGFQNLQFNASDVAESVQPLIGSSLENVSGITANYFPIPSPQFSSVASFNTTASASFQNLKSSSLNPEVTVPSSDISASVKNKGNMGIWNATINSINYVGNVNTAGQTESVYVEVVFTKANNMNAVLLAWGGHIASIADWGLGNSASAIPGSPYHMYVDYISTTGTTPNIICSGNMDCQTASASIVVPPTCSITGPNTLCGGTISSVYTATLDAAQNGTVSYLWSLTNQSPSAGAQLTGTISDSTNAVTVTGTVIPISTYFNEGGNFMLRLRVERKGVIDYCYYNSIDSPGAFIHVNAIAASASATPSSYSLNETSTSNLSVNVKLEGIDSNAAFTYHWTRMGTGGAIGASLSDENSRTPTLTATLAGTYNYKVIVTQIAAPYCIDSATVSVVVSPLQQCPDVLTAAVCAGAVNNVYVASFLPDQNVTYNWTVNNGATIVYNNNADTIKVNAGSGNFDIQLKMSYANPNANDNYCTYPVTVNPLPIINTGSYSPLCADASPITLSGTPSGGTWSGTGVSGNQFTPSSAGTFKVKYSYTDANGCSNADSTNITVNANPTVSAGSYSPLCKDASPITLSGTPSGGTWSGTGVSGSEFTPSGAGTFKVKYSYTDANGCSNADSTNITVNANPTISAGSYSPLCADASPITLSGTPSGGTWSGTGVSGSEFTPSGAGTFKVKYSYTDANGCSNADSTNITVNANPTVSAGSYSPLCKDASPITLSGTPSGGTWSGTGVSGDQFTPSSAGTFKVKYSYTDANGCSNADSTNITVNANPTVSAGSYSPLCSDASPITLSGTPSGGTWSGTGVSGDQFTPSTEGTFKVKYNYTDANGCSGADSVNITVKVCQYVNACTVTQGYYGSTNGNMCDEDSIYTGAVSFIRKLLSSGPITIGSGVRTLTIQVTDSARVNAILPGGGTPTTFTHTGNIYLTSSQFSNYLTKQGKINNILLSQTITLALNVRIKSDLNGLVLHNGYIHTQKLKACNGNGVVSCEEDPSAIQAWPMKSSVVNYLAANGGATVSNLLNLANAVLGRTKIPGQSGSGGTVVPSLGDIASQVDVINNAFDKCRLFLDFESSPNLCPGLTISNFNKEEISEKTQSNGPVNKVAVELVKEFKVSAYPNPFNDIIKFSIESPSEMKIAIELYDMNGRNLGRFYEGSILPNERKLIQINSPNITGQIVYRVVTPTKVITGTLLKLEK